MKTHTVLEGLAGLSFFHDMPESSLAFLSGCASHVRFKQGDFMLYEGKPAHQFFIIREGLVALEVEAANKMVTIQTLNEGSIVGWSWLVPPYTWHYDARAKAPVAAFAFDADCVRRKCEQDPAFGYEVLKRFASVIVERLMATRVQLIDVYQ